jgi:hypothetical protein
MGHESETSLGKSPPEREEIVPGDAFGAVQRDRFLRSDRGFGRRREHPIPMQTSSNIAFKEWAVVCAALASGRQTLILRKGGIHEGREGFRVQHREFWLFPTQFHQQPDEIIPEAWPLLLNLAGSEPSGFIPINRYCVVQDVCYVRDLAVLQKLSGHHIWSPAAVKQRFEYRTPGLFVLVVRVFQRQTPFWMAESANFSGCRSWVEFDEQLPTADLHAVLDSDTFQSRRAEILDLVSSSF